MSRRRIRWRKKLKAVEDYLDRYDGRNVDLEDVFVNEVQTPVENKNADARIDVNALFEEGNEDTDVDVEVDEDTDSDLEGEEVYENEIESTDDADDRSDFQEKEEADTFIDENNKIDNISDHTSETVTKSLSMIALLEALDNDQNTEEREELVTDLTKSLNDLIQDGNHNSKELLEMIRSRQD